MKDLPTLYRDQLRKVFSLANYSKKELMDILNDVKNRCRKKNQYYKITKEEIKNRIKILTGGGW